jgi:hypothetical protein
MREEWRNRPPLGIDEIEPTFDAIEAAIYAIVAHGRAFSVVRVLYDATRHSR